MPVTPSGRTRLTVRSMGGTVIFDGEGEVTVQGTDPGRGAEGTAVLRVRDGDYRATMDLTGLLMSAQHQWDVEWDVPPLEMVDPDTVAVPELPRVVHTTLNIDIPSSFALSLRRELYAGHPDRAVHEAERTLYQQLTGRSRAHEAAVRLMCDPEPLTDEEVRRIYSECVMSPEDFRRQAGYPPQHTTEPEDTWEAAMSRQRVLYAAREELMESTRAEFPPDPYDYGRRHPEGPHRWTPPDDPDEVIKSCPA